MVENATSAVEPKTLLEAIRYYSDLDVATIAFSELRWPDGPVCPYCESKESYYAPSRRIWKCKLCRKQFSPKVGTVCEDSPIGFDKWLTAMWMIANDKNGISSWELHRGLDVTQKTAWFMLQRIRLAMQNGTFEKATGRVEVDTKPLSAAKLETCTSIFVKRRSPELAAWIRQWLLASWSVVARSVLQ